MRHEFTVEADVPQYLIDHYKHFHFTQLEKEWVALTGAHCKPSFERFEWLLRYSVSKGLPFDVRLIGSFQLSDHESWRHSVTITIPPRVVLEDIKKRRIALADPGSWAPAALAVGILFGLSAMAYWLGITHGSQPTRLEAASASTVSTYTQSLPPLGESCLDLIRVVFNQEPEPYISYSPRADFYLDCLKLRKETVQLDVLLYNFNKATGLLSEKSNEVERQAEVITKRNKEIESLKNRLKGTERPKECSSEATVNASPMERGCKLFSE